MNTALRTSRTAAGLLAIVSMLLPPAVRAADPVPTPAEVEKITRAVPAQATVKPQKHRRLLVFSVTRGYRHSAIPFGKKAIELMASKTGAFEAVISDDPAEFEPANLARYDAVFLNNTNNEIFLPERLDALSVAELAKARQRGKRLRESLASFVAGGKGLAVIHAGVASFRKWPEFGTIMGARFDSHPWNSGSRVTLKIEDCEHPLTRAFGGDRFVVSDEIYQFREYSRDRLRVLLSLDTARTDMNRGARIHRKDGDFALGWVKAHGKGRVFYCALGHDHEIYWNPTVLRHYLDGIQFALGDLKAEMGPRRVKTTARRAGAGAPGSEVRDRAPR